MKKTLRFLLDEYGWVHLAIGLFGNVCFLAGSILFLETFKEYKTAGVWLFIIGAAFMLIGAVGELLVSLWVENHDEEQG